MEFEKIRKGKIDDILYDIFHDYYFSERSANVNAGKLLVELFNGTRLEKYAKSIYVAYLYKYSYFKIGKKVISPLDKTLFFLRGKNEITASKLPFEVAFNEGGPITDSEYDIMFGGISWRYKPCISYSKTLSKIRQLDKERGY